MTLRQIRYLYPSWRIEEIDQLLAGVGLAVALLLAIVAATIQDGDTSRAP